MLYLRSQIVLIMIVFAQAAQRVFRLKKETIMLLLLEGPVLVSKDIFSPSERPMTRFTLAQVKLNT